MVTAPPRRVTPFSCAVVANQRSARLFSVSHPHEGTDIRLELLATRDNALRPHDRGGRPAGTGVTGISYADADRDRDVMREQFAAEVVQWLADEMRRRPTDGTLRLIAPPEFLGALRRALASRPLAAKVIECPTDLANLSVARLEHHPTMIDQCRTAG